MRRRQDYGVMGLGKAEFKGLVRKKCALLRVVKTDFTGLGGNSPNFLGLHILRGEHFPGK
ncbi:MAG: hypothetical protein QS98_C0002G0102 [archaeon GW2011_AR3]|nr:MAG: hypothetical protein QS98_C0002G0102 [archaeon GW2011_AR3]MBS3109908.1 hypothetical protein [Candidatus Woesearchaeota archaeon]